MKKLLIIGAGIGQIPLLEKAKQLGVHTTVVSKPGDYPGFALADAVCPLDIYDRDAIVDYARDHAINAVLSDQNDLMMPTVAYVAEHLDLPGNRFEQTLDYCNKNRFRDCCETLGIPVPRHIHLDSDEIPEAFCSIPLPWIVKPEDSQSSIGVTKISTLDEFSPAARLALDKSRNHRAILEEFFVGREVVCEGFVYHGRHFLLAFGDRRYFTLPNLLIPSQTLFPSDLPKDIQERILECERRMASHVGLRFAIIHSEYLVNEQSGEIRVVESAPRGGGVYISSHLIPLSTGIDCNDLLLRLALGEEVDVEAAFANRSDAAAGYVCFYLPEGEIASVDGLGLLEKNPHVAAMFLGNIQEGTVAGKMLHKGMRKGPILVTGANRSDLERNIAEIQHMFKVLGKTADGRLEDIHWE